MMYEKAHKEKVFDEIFKSISIINDTKSLKGRLPKRCFTYETLKNSMVSNETTFSAHKCPTKSYKLPDQGVPIAFGVSRRFWTQFSPL